ncbi:MAG: tRNA uridine-5-carboxymethylaminomethyl(34) synthesis GTPase MnmE [Firmicutes bacterium]|nr:tRNA uridine-5-carboxymethylaminomethyl(34) synthesis GTPase MnmE [Bacillota bacterium]
MGGTIAAISTAAGEAGIGIVRLSGPDAIGITGRMFRGPRGGGLPANSHSVVYGHVVDPRSGEIIDEVLVTVFRAPRSYTREDVVEIGCHGGLAAVRGVLQAALRAGARAALPGEFTARAFLNGRLDLSQAEAVLDLVRSKTGRAAAAALAQLQGGLSGKVRRVREDLLDVVAWIEAGIDFPDEVGDPPGDELAKQIGAAALEIGRLLNSAGSGRILREGIRVALAGRPNVGKSSLMNALLRMERAIVTDVPGTTRDTIEEGANILGFPVTLVDMAGLRDTRDAVEAAGVARARGEIEAADVVVIVLDDSAGLGDEDRRAIDNARRAPGVRVVAVNKVDLGAGALARVDLEGLCGASRAVRVSARTGENIGALEEAIVAAAGGTGSSGGSLAQVVVTNARHAAALERAAAALDEAESGVKSGLPVDLASTALRDAVDALGEITGDTAGEEIIDRIFREFCVGK